jgi:hypothetical protein
MPTQTTPRPIPSSVGSPPPPIDHVRIGDAAGEYRFIRRGKYRAWAYVVVSFVFEICILSGEIYALLKYTKAGSNQDAAVLVAVAAGILLSIWVYNDRWRCIEAFSSRFFLDAGPMSFITAHLCMGYMPIIALFYANYRGLRKLLGS